MPPHRIACTALGLALVVCATAVPSTVASAPPAPAVATAAPTAVPAAAVNAAVGAKPEPSPSPSLSPSPSPSLLPVELVAVSPSPLSGPPPSLSITAPTKNQVIPTAKAPTFEIKFSVKGWKLSAGGDNLCVVLDRRPCRRFDDPKSPLRLQDLDASIDEGQHVITVLARRASGEFARPAGKSVPFASSSFFVGKKVPPIHKDGTPMLFFSPPEPGPAPRDGVLIDYYVGNAEIASGKFVIHASVGGPGIEQGVGIAIHEPKPMRLRNARPGDYIARLNLMRFMSQLGESKSFTTVTSNAQPVDGLFSEVTRSFRVTGP